MADTLDGLKRQLNSIQSQINNAVRRNNQLNSEIRELEAARRKLQYIKRHTYPSADSIKRDVKKDSLCSGYEWRGKSKKEYDDKVNGEIKKAAQDLWNSIDRMEAEIYDEIARKQGQKFSLDPLNKTKAWLTAKIRNWVD